MNRNRLLLQGAAVTIATFAVLRLAALLLPERVAGHRTAWGYVVLLVLALFAQAFGLIRLNQSRDGMWRDGKAVLAILLSVCGWVLLLAYGSVALRLFQYALSPGSRLFQ